MLVNFSALIWRGGLCSESYMVFLGILELEWAMCLLCNVCAKINV